MQRRSFIKILSGLVPYPAISPATPQAENAVVAQLLGSGQQLEVHIVRLKNGPSPWGECSFQ